MKEKTDFSKDYVAVWKCKCGKYAINFAVNVLYCSNCGEEMKLKEYKELKPNKVMCEK